jgi:GT2 family glycosyltransferase
MDVPGEAERGHGTSQLQPHLRFSRLNPAEVTQLLSDGDMADGILEDDTADCVAELTLRSTAPTASPRAVGDASDVTPAAYGRPHADGKFFFAGSEKLTIRGVTYGPFAPHEDGCEYGTRGGVESDFAQMRACGLNAVRTYTVPPRWLLDVAQRVGLYVMVGLPWEQHVTFLDRRRTRNDIVERVRHGVAACAGHPAVCGYAIGNEIPAPIARWYGPRRIERWLQRLYDVAKLADPGSIVTYVNYPSTEYLELPFLDFVAFNVYLETPAAQRRYLSRLHNIAGDRPLLVAEAGLDGLRNGEGAQAAALDWQVSTALSCGCAGLFVFSWTDEWHRGGHDVTDWQFGLTDRTRRPRPALAAVRHAFDKPLLRDRACPRVSVIVCTFNGARTLAECLDGLSRLDYPDFEVIVVDDGSVDDSAQIARRPGVRLIQTPNGGLSSARNVGLHASTGEIVAYIDDDAYPDSDWLTHLVAAVTANGEHAAVGGPNIPPHADPPLADCVAHAPGGPAHVLLTDTLAEHIPGCNIAFRRDRLVAVGGFDPLFRIAGDDVDICWRLQERGWTLGFSAAAVVWHHRRNSIRAYLKQQLNYGRAEALLERKWPRKYNRAGHPVWSGRLYSRVFRGLLPWSRRRIYHGTWGTALFQSVYQPAPSLVASLPTMPEWYLCTAIICVIALGGMLYRSLAWAAPFAAAMVLVTLVTAVGSAARARLNSGPGGVGRRAKYRVTLVALHLMQPAVRLAGRLHRGLAPWRLRGADGFALPCPRAFTVWSQRWKSIEARLAALESALRKRSGGVMRGGDFDRWDLQLIGGMFGGSARLHAAVEEHGSGRQLVRFRTYPCWNGMGPLMIAILSAAGAVAVWGGLLPLSTLAFGAASLLLIAAARESSAALATLRRALQEESAADA